MSVSEFLDPSRPGTWLDMLLSFILIGIYMAAAIVRQNRRLARRRREWRP